MTEKERDNIVRMLSSSDEEMQQLGISTLSSLVKVVEEYIFLRQHHNYKHIQPMITKVIRKNFINSHGKIKRKFKNW